jgi:hypothetical protein
MWEKYTSTRCMPEKITSIGCMSEKITSTTLKDNFSRREKIPKSTRRPIYTIAKAPESILKTRRRSRPHH